MLQTHSETTFSAEAEQSTVLLDGIGKIPFVVVMLSTSNKNSYHQAKTTLIRSLLVVRTKRYVQDSYPEKLSF